MSGKFRRQVVNYIVHDKLSPWKLDGSPREAVHVVHNAHPNDVSPVSPGLPGYVASHCNERILALDDRPDPSLLLRNTVDSENRHHAPTLLSSVLLWRFIA